MNTTARCPDAVLLAAVERLWDEWGYRDTLTPPQFDARVQHYASHDRPVRLVADRAYAAGIQDRGVDEPLSRSDLGELTQALDDLVLLLTGDVPDATVHVEASEWRPATDLLELVGPLLAELAMRRERDETWRTLTGALCLSSPVHDERVPVPDGSSSLEPSAVAAISASWPAVGDSDD